jgi:hypothetical protein
MWCLEQRDQKRDSDRAKQGNLSEKRNLILCCGGLLLRRNHRQEWQEARPHNPCCQRLRRGHKLSLASGTTQQSDYWQSTVSPFASAYRVTSSGATGDPASPPEVTRHSSVPCRPQSPCFWWVNEKRLRLPIAGSTLPHLRPTGSSSGWSPSITARHFSSCPSDSASRRTPCPPGIAERWLQVRLGCVRLSSSCPFRLLHTFPSPRPARSYPRLWIRRSSFERRRDLNPPESRAAQRTISLVHPPRSAEGPSVAPPTLLELRQVVLAPSENRCMRHGNAAVCHHDHQIPEAQLEARVPGDTQDDDLPVEVPSFEEIFDRYEPLHLSIIVRHPAFAPEPVGRDLRRLPTVMTCATMSSL